MDNPSNISFFCIITEKVNEVNYKAKVHAGNILLPPADNTVIKNVNTTVELPLNKLIYVDEAVITNKGTTSVAVIISSYFTLERPECLRVVPPTKVEPTLISDKIKEIIEDSSRYPFELFLD